MHWDVAGLWVKLWIHCMQRIWLAIRTRQALQCTPVAVDSTLSSLFKGSTFFTPCVFWRTIRYSPQTFPKHVCTVKVLLQQLGFGKNVAKCTCRLYKCFSWWHPRVKRVKWGKKHASRTFTQKMFTCRTEGKADRIMTKIVAVSSK